LIRLRLDEKILVRTAPKRKILTASTFVMNVRKTTSRKQKPTAFRVQNTEKDCIKSYYVQAVLQLIRSDNKGK
jgi:hypothetical protein